MRLLRAGWVVPVSSRPIADGAVVFDDDGVLVAVGAAEHLSVAHPRATAEDLGRRALVMPGLIDAHCHLEWSCLDGVIGPQPFGMWLRRFMPLRRHLGGDDHLAAARSGALRALRAGTTLVADSGPTGAGTAALNETGLRGVVHLETFGAPRRAAARDHARAVGARVEELAGRAGARIAVGISPHAPYSVGPELWRALADHPQLAARPWATHLAESPDEERALLRGDGPLAECFAEMGAELGRWDDDADASVVARVDAHDGLRRGMVAAHCVRLHRRDAARLRRAGVRVAHCPRSNAYLRCGTAPVPALLGAGVQVAIGTDSPASGGDYDLRAEARACREALGGISPADHQLLRMITHDAARALGRGDELGALEPGMRADLTVLDLGAIDDADEATDAHALALDPRARVERVLVDGHQLMRAGRPELVDAEAIEVAALTIAARLR